MPPLLSRFLSYVLHPLLMPLYAVILVMQLNTYIAYSVSPQLQRIIFSLVFLTTAAFPVLTAMILLQKGRIRSFEMETVAERRIPFLAASVCYLICYYLLLRLPVPRMLSLMVLGAAITVIIAWLLSFRWKVSIHMIGIGGLTGMMFGLSQVLNAGLELIIVGIIILSGFLGTARMQLGAHTSAQIYTGFAIGFITEWLILRWFTS